MTPSDFVQSMPIAVLHIRADDRIGAMNLPAKELFGDGAQGRHFITVLRQPGVLDCVELVRISGAPAETRFETSEAGRDVVYRATVSPLVEGQGILMAFEDVTPVEEAGQMRADFVANVSHELRTPLTALSGFIETLRGPARDDASARDRFLGIMEREAGRMNRLVDDLLSLSRVESEERRLPSERIDLSALLSGAVQTLRPATEAAGMKLVLTGADQPLPISADADQITQVFQNLIENAIKYGAGGEEVRVEIHPVQHEPVLRGPAVRVDVIDQGEGIDQIHLPRLTERFYRVDTHRSREKGGTGLGLAIVKHIINRHRGRFRVHSIPGNGSRFSVMLPADKTPGGE